MKKAITAIILCAAMILSCVSFSVTGFAVGATYYVDSENGSDSNTGTSESNAWKTLEKASSITYSAGDKILFKAGGVYTGSFTAKGNGTKENPITISSYGNTEKDGLPVFTTQEDTMLVNINNVNGWCVENLELTAPNGKGIWIVADREIGTMKDITVKNCTFHDINYKDLPSHPDKNAPVYIASNGKDAILENITISGLNIYNCGRGISTFGTTIEWHRDIFVSPEVSYNRNFVFEDITMDNILYDAIIVTAINGIVIRNSALLNTALLDNWCTAPLWSHHVKNMLVENCEIAGSTNIKDGMAVDFDGWTTDSMYQYIYSHDNVRFITNCVYDNITQNANCTVRYCLSVNDNKTINNMAWRGMTSAYDYTINNDVPKYMYNFKFYNNTIVNGCEFDLEELENAYIANNIFCGDLSMTFATKHISRDKKNGTEEVFELNGTFTNNCFYGCAIPIKSENSITADPQFIGTDYDDINSFKLSKNSPLLGKGVQVEEDMGEFDFYGNPLTDTHNIGCYEGVGEETENTKSLFSYVPDFFKIIAGYILGLYVDFREYYL